MRIGWPSHPQAKILGWNASDSTQLGEQVGDNLLCKAVFRIHIGEGIDMAITLQAQPTQLTWAHFVPVAHLVDPADGEPIDAYTTFDFEIPDRPPRHVEGGLALADPLVITIRPNCRVRLGVAQTAALLDHEQFHYDVGIVTGRALARHLMRLRAPTLAALRTALQDAVRLHFSTRAGLLQRRYDQDTRHGTNAHYQRIWKNRMTACLANPNADQLGGFYL